MPERESDESPQIDAVYVRALGIVLDELSVDVGFRSFELTPQGPEVVDIRFEFPFSGGDEQEEIFHHFNDHIGFAEIEGFIGGKAEGRCQLTKDQAWEIVAEWEHRVIP